MQKINVTIWNEFIHEKEENYGERFEIPTPDELIFISWFSMGEVFRMCYVLFAKKNILNCVKYFPYKKLWIYIILIVIFLFFNTYLTTLANTFIHNTVLIYPLKFGSNLILSAIMAAVLFKEKINRYSILGMTLISISIIFINIL